MKHLKHTVFFMALTAALLTATVQAEEITVDPTTQFTFSAADFTNAEQDEGIFLISVPNPKIADLCLGDRTLQAGDALTRDALDQISLHTECVTKQDIAIEYCTVANGSVSEKKALQLSILPKKNEPPIAEASALETYKNIANTGELRAHDPENGILTFTLVEAPKRGSVELHEDGSFTYTPEKNKVGKDSFTFIATDDAGNESEAAKVTIQIKKPTDKATYADMAGDSDAYCAVWMKEAGLFSGSTIGGNLCFGPDETVSRGEFLVMVMKLVEADADEIRTTSGFADEKSTPEWLQPYLTAALRNGMISGISANEGVVFQSNADMTKSEAAVMLQNILQLPTTETQAVFSPEKDPAIPVWAAEAAAALSESGYELNITSSQDPLTRLDAAKLLHHVKNLLDTKAVATFYWVQ